MIDLYTGTIGSGKSYHALEDIVEALRKGKHVIANFPLKFSDVQKKKGLHKRFLYVDDVEFAGMQGIKQLVGMSKPMGFYGNEGSCLVVLDEVGNYFPPDEYSHPTQKAWKKFFTQSRKLGYDFLLICQEDRQINRTIRKCVEYEVIHRKANAVFPFSLLNIFGITIFMYVTNWKQTRTRLKADSSIFVKKLADMYDSYKLFSNLDELGAPEEFLPKFGNCGDCNPEKNPEVSDLTHGEQ